MKPRDIKSLLDYLRSTGQFDKLQGNLLTQWGPADAPLLGANFLPPRVVDKNQDTIEDVRYRTVAAPDGTRYSPAQIVDSGELFGRINYRLGHSDLARQIAGPDYDGIVNWLNRSMDMAAAGRVMGIFDTYIIQGLVQHDELAIWDAIVFNKIARRGDNAYYEYQDGPTLAGHRISASVDWTDPNTDPWAADIIPMCRLLARLGYERSGIRIITTDHVIQTLADHPSTARRSITQFIPTGQTVLELAGQVTESDVDTVFRKLKVQAPITYDLRIQTKTGERRVYPEGHMTFIASTGRTEEVIYNVSDPSKVQLVRDTLGFNGIGTANGQSSAGRRSAARAFTNQKDSRIELEGWQATGPVILEPTAICDISGIATGSSWP